ncbi:MAG: 3-dehydro-L-gulonate 2-dehydrogenase [Bacteroidota bacterium]
MLRIPFTEVHEQLTAILLRYDFSTDRANLCARLFAETTLDGVYSHGLNRFFRFIDYIQKGYVNVHTRSEKVEGGFGAIEKWDGQLGVGNLNAWQGMQRAMQIADTFGIGLVALKNTNHWMRGGTYGWQAAENGYIGLCFTNTIPNMPAWGTKDAVLGNNPLVIAFPRSEGHIVLDTAMSQFSYGKLEITRLKGELLSVPGGFDESGHLTRDPATIEKTGRVMPMGYWKGAGLSLLLDLLAASLSDGLGTTQVGAQQEQEYGISQVFIAIAPKILSPQHSKIILDETLAAIHQATPNQPNGKAYYPGERTFQTRRENLEKGIPIDESFWKALKSL